MVLECQNRLQLCQHQCGVWLQARNMKKHEEEDCWKR